MEPRVLVVLTLRILIGVPDGLVCSLAALTLSQNF